MEDREGLWRVSAGSWPIAVVSRPGASVTSCYNLGDDKDRIHKGDMAADRVPISEHCHGH